MHRREHSLSHFPCYYILTRLYCYFHCTCIVWLNRGLCNDDQFDNFLLNLIHSKHILNTRNWKVDNTIHITQIYCCGHDTNRSISTYIVYFDHSLIIREVYIARQAQLPEQHSRRSGMPRLWPASCPSQEQLGHHQGGVVLFHKDLRRWLSSPNMLWDVTLSELSRKALTKEEFIKLLQTFIVHSKRRGKQ